MALAATQFALDRNERELWAGAPRTGIVFRGVDAFLIPYSVFCAGFAVFWEVLALRSGPAFFAIFGAVVVLVGLHFVFGRFLYDAWRRGRTVYQLTTQRIIIANGATLKSLDLRTLSDVTLSERPDGSGTITFGPTSFQTMINSGMVGPGVPQIPAFEFIPEARRVYSLIRDAQRASVANAG